MYEINTIKMQDEVVLFIAGVKNVNRIAPPRSKKAYYTNTTKWRENLREVTCAIKIQ